MGASASRCAWLVFGSKDTVTQDPFFSVPHLSPMSPVSQYFALARLTFPECPSRTVTAMKGIPEMRSEEHTSELQSRFDLVCRLLLEKKKILSHPRNHTFD